MKTSLKKAVSALIASSMLIPAALAFADEAPASNNKLDLQEKIAEMAKSKGIDYVVPTVEGGTGTATVTLDADTKVKLAESNPARSDVTYNGTKDYGDSKQTISALANSRTTAQGGTVQLTGDFQSTLNMGKVREAFEAYKLAAEAYSETNPLTEVLVKTVPVTGAFKITVTYDAGMTPADEAYHTTVGNMNGFNAEAKEVFFDTAREIREGAWKVGKDGQLAEQTVTNGKTYKTLVIDVAVKAPTTLKAEGVHDGAWADTLVYADLDEHYQELLADISYDVNSVTVGGEYSSRTYFTESISMGGSIKIGNTLSEISFLTQQENAKQNSYSATQGWQDISATMSLDYKSSSNGGGSNTGITTNRTPRPANTPRPTTDPNATMDPNATIDPNATMDPNATPVVGTPDPNNNPVDPNRTPRPTVPPFVPTNSKVPSALNGEDHMVYVIGYPEGDVRPLRSISREEVATIFYRLLTNEKRESIYTKESSFSDVLKSRWSNKAIATMANGKYILGDAGATTFRPADAITRAEMAAIVTRFLDEPVIADTSLDYLDDIGGHWAETAIRQGIAAGWLTGYEDYTYKPDQLITRAEAMTVINRMLVRYVREGGLAENYVQWPDNPSDAWYYYNVIEATNSHTYNDRDFSTPDGFYETWGEVVTNWVWGDFKTNYEDPDEIDKQ